MKLDEMKLGEMKQHVEISLHEMKCQNFIHFMKFR